MAHISSHPVKVAILDDYQGISAPHFEPKFDITVFRDTLLPYNHPGTPEHVKQELVDRLKPFTVICSMRERTPFPASLLHELPHLQLLLTTGAKNASIDTGAAKQLGIRVTGALGQGRSDSPKASTKLSPRDPTISTTQHTVALILGIARNIAHDDMVVKKGGWETQLAYGLAGKVFGTLGFGRLGFGVAKIMHQAFGMRIVAWSSSLTQKGADEKAKEAGLPTELADGEKTFKVVGKEELFQTADVVSVHYVLSNRSKGLVGEKELALMKKSAFFVNTSRGPLVVESALLDALKAGRIRGAAIDVFDLEPLPTDSPWRTTEWGQDGRSHVLLTPHMGYVEEELLNSWYDEQVENIERWQKGLELRNVIV